MFTKKFANVKLNGDSEDDEDQKMKDPMGKNSSSFIKNSSMCMFHIDSKVRRFCLEMSETHEDFQTFVNTRNRHKYFKADKEFPELKLKPYEDIEIPVRLIDIN
jgi:hypothetical protein